MTMSDPIADMLTRIRNANTAKHDTVDVPASKMKLAIADILVREGYIKKYDIVEDGAFQTIRISLKYGADKNEKIISGIKKISKPAFVCGTAPASEIIIVSIPFQPLVLIHFSALIYKVEIVVIQETFVLLQGTVRIHKIPGAIDLIPAIG